MRPSSDRPQTNQHSHHNNQHQDHHHEPLSINVDTANSYETDLELIRAFEALTLPPGQFHHVEHVRLAWSYLQHYPLCEAIERFVTGLQRFAAVHGQAERYHATITWAYILLINERLATQPSSNWADFAAANPDLLNWQSNVLSRYYRETTLQSAIARRVFVFPDNLVDGNV
jgi:hypothetical protein